jgi:Putative adhesin
MSVFETPEPIHVVVSVMAGEVRIAASERQDTVVEVRPSDASRREDVTAADQTRVEFDGGTLSVKTPKGLKSLRPWSHSGLIDVQVEMPAGSRVTGSIAMGQFRCVGPLGDCDVKTAASDIHVDEAATVRLTTTSGDITIDHATGDAHLTTASGVMRAGEIEGTATINSSNGDVEAGEIDGDARIQSAHGDITLEYARGSVSAKTGKGNIRVGAAERGSVVGVTGYGGVEVGVADGTAAWLDLSTGFGQVHNGLDQADNPRPDEGTVEVHARTGYGDITIRRAYPVHDADTTAEQL